jgi:hypothetical protein
MALLCTFLCVAASGPASQRSARPAASGAATASERPTINRRTGLFEPPLSDLRKAALHGDRAELARAAARLGPARLAKVLGDRDTERASVLAALDAVAELDTGLLLLDAVLPYTAAPDDGVRAKASATLAALLAPRAGDALAELEIPSETVRATCQALARLADNDNEEVATRLVAIQGLAEAADACGASVKPTLLAAARDPEIRRAGLLALPHTPEADGVLLAAVHDGDGRVAAAAGARLCSRKAAIRPAVARFSLGQLALLDGAMAEDIIEMLPCLLSSTDAADRKVVSELEKTGAPAVRDAIKRLR